MRSFRTADHDRPRPSVGAIRGDEGERPDVAPEGRDHGVVDGLAPVRTMSVVGLGRVGWRLALPPLVELGGASRAPLRIKHPVDSLRIDRPPFGTRLLEVVLAQPRLLRHLGAFAIDLRLGQPPVGFERVPIAPLVDGPAPGGGALEHRGHRAVGVLMRTADDRLGLHARPVHRLTVRGVEHRQRHLIGFVDPEALRVRPAHGGLGGGQGRDRVAPHEAGFPHGGGTGEEVGGCLGRAPQARHHLQHPFRLLGRAPEHGDVRFERDGLDQGQEREQRGLAAEAARRFPHSHVRAVEIGITEGLRRRHMLGAAGHRRNVDAKRLFRQR